MFTRKDFLRTGSLGLLGLFVGQPDDVLAESYTEPALDANKSWDDIRALFDLDPERIFLNNGTMGPSPKPVIQAVHDRMVFVNKVGKYGGGEKKCRQALASLVHADMDEIAMTHNVTEGINIAAWGLPLKKGDEVILSTHEHVGNAGPWLNLRRLKGIRIKVVPLGKSAEDTLRIIQKAVSKRTKVIAVPHIPCTIGQVLPVNELCAWARSKGIWTVVDGAHGTGMLKLDLQQMQCDVYVSCCHKWLLAPKGTAYLYVRKDFQHQLESLQTGGYSAEHWVLNEKEVYFKGLTESAHKYFYGTQSSPLYFGVTAAVEFQQSIGIERIEARVRELNQQLLEGVKSIKGLDVLTPEEAASRGGVLSVKFRKKDNRAFFDACAAKQITIRYVGESELDCVRISTHFYNSPTEVEQIIREITDYARS
ncbi:MAG: aminotransferase class V-fold PLP-dependent enzyme [Flavobacteriales bacterium]|nr:aminotransferase class V-fold PLP-dependent enzyme [Bacteroidota bacterium]MCB9241384.1 aminotransferase class V-fold PLP-dependent enzyme [Flavobacteriales bacterium]